MKLDAVLDLEVPEDEVVKRIAGRRICRNDSAHVFHVTYSPPKAEGVCDACGGELYQRDDDSEETVRKRLEVYHTQTEPIIDYYKAQGLVVTISALGKVAEVTARAMEALQMDRPPRPEPSRPVRAGTAAVSPGRRGRTVEQTCTAQTRKAEGTAMVQIKTPEQIAKMREAGLVVAAIHAATREAAVPGATTRDLDEVARKVIADHGAKSNFLGYGGFPATICTSVNEVVVHGIPDDKTVLKDGDIISIDAGAIIDGWHGDAAYTAFVGTGHAPELVELSRVTEESMWAGIAAMKIGNRLVDISKAIETLHPPPAASAGARGKYGIIEDYGGHGIGTEMHMDPHLLNYVSRKRGKGLKLVPGLCLAIEPMVSLGTAQTEVLPDDWTVITTDGTWSSHWEHSIALTEEGPLVLTARTAARRSWRSTASRRLRTPSAVMI